VYNLEIGDRIKSLNDNREGTISFIEKVESFFDTTLEYVIHTHVFFDDKTIGICVGNPFNNLIKIRKEENNTKILKANDRVQLGNITTKGIIFEIISEDDTAMANVLWDDSLVNDGGFSYINTKYLTKINDNKGEKNNMKDMGKSDLKIGVHLCKYRIGDWVMIYQGKYEGVKQNAFVHKNSTYMPFEHYTQNLKKINNNKDYDIVEIKETEHPTDIIKWFQGRTDIYNFETIWTEKQTHTITIDGKDIEISKESYNNLKKHFNEN